MATLLFFNIPGYGHVIPTLPLVAELNRRGHRVVYFATETFRPLIERANAEYRATPGVPDDFFDAGGLSGKVPMKVAARLMATAGENLPQVLEQARAESPDLILYDGTCAWGYFAARALGIPAVASLALLPVASGRAAANWQTIRLLLPMLARGLRDGLDANRRSKALGKQYGVPPLTPTELMSAPGDLALCYTSREFVGYADLVPDYIRFVGWTMRDDQPDVPAYDHRSERALVYISLGTLNNKDGALYRTLITAFADSAADVLISTGRHFAPGTFSKNPENVAIRSWVDQASVLRQSALFVSHGGLNSIHEALSLGVPLLLIPQQTEQTINSLRVAELGAGLVLRGRQVNASAVRNAANRILADSSFQAAAQRIGDTLRASGGAVTAADAVEALLKPH